MKVKLEFVLREIAGDILLVPAGKTALDLNGMLTLNEIGAEIWKMLPEVQGEEEIVERLLREYDAEPAQVRADVAEFLDRLRELGIVYLLQYSQKIYRICLILMDFDTCQSGQYRI